MIAESILACGLALVADIPIKDPIQRIIQVESGGRELAVNVNRWDGPQPRPNTVAEAVAIAQTYIATGRSVDLGLMQINSRNLESLGLTIEQVLDPCTNVKAGATIIAADYRAAASRFEPGEAAWRVALSHYNTGTSNRGFENGYVAKYTGNASKEGTPRGKPKAPDPYGASPVVWQSADTQAQMAGIRIQ